MCPIDSSSSGQADIPDLSRVTYFDGERLAAVDLNDAARVQRELRWLHNRSLHNWGIGLGFGVSGNKGDRQVQVAPGYAIDCLGREIILTETISKAVPARAGDSQGNPVIYYLVAAYPDDATLTVLERRQGECGADGAVRLQERAAIYWKAQGEQAVQVGKEIVLAQATVQNCQLAKPLSLDQRRSARPLQQPFVAAGETPLGETPWQAWTLPSNSPPGTPPPGTPAPAQLLGVTTFVDTSAARFGSTPEYQVRVRGQRVFTPGSPTIFAGIAAVASPIFILEGMAFISNTPGSLPDRNGFTLNVLMPAGLTTATEIPINPQWLLSSADNLLQIVRASWSVVWVGSEG